MINLLKKFWKWILVSVFGAGIALAAPVIPVEMQWVVSYETIAFETKDGDLGMNEYAAAGENEWYIREVPKNRGQFVSTTTEPLGKKEVQIQAMKSPENPDCTGCAYYSEFKGRSGRIVRVNMNKVDYDGLRFIRRFPQPKRTERVSVVRGNETEAAIAFDATTNSGHKSGASSYSFSHTSTGDDLVMVAGVSMFEATDADRDVSDITYNSVSLTKIREDDNATPNVETHLWQLAGPVTGSNTVSVTFAGVVSSSVTGIVTLTGVDQTNPVDANNGATKTGCGGGCNVSTNVTTTVDNVWLVDAIMHRDTDAFGHGLNTLNVGANQTQRWNIDTAANDHGGSTEEATTAGSYTMSWSCSGFFCDDNTEKWAISAASFAPAGAGGGEETPAPTQEIIWFSED